MQIAVVGLGYVGLVTAAGFACAGHEVVGIERDPGRLAALAAGRVPIHEPGLETLLSEATADRRIHWSASATAAAAVAVAIVAVGTDDGAGGWQTDTIERCLADLVPHLADDAVLVLRSTLPPAFVDGLVDLVQGHRRNVGRGDLPILLNPEFTSEGSAVRDFLAADRVVIGVAADPDDRGVALVRRLYAGLGAPIVVQTAIDACLTKIGSNLFLATKISFANELAALCEIYGAGVDAVVGGMAHDVRIGGSFLRPGVGYGGSCLPHQVRMVVHSGREAGLPMRLLGAVDDVNRGQVRHVVGLLETRLGNLDGARIALLGLAFKPHTDDVREAPALAIAAGLADRGALVVGYDPMIRARERALQLVPTLAIEHSAPEALRGADGAVLATEWPEFRQLDWVDAIASMARPIVVDGRNALDGASLRALGCDYVGFGLPRAWSPDRRADSAAVTTKPAPAVSSVPSSDAPVGGHRHPRASEEPDLAAAELRGAG